MNWIDFFFGWLTKGQYEVSILDTVMLFIEIIILFYVSCAIQDFMSKRKKKR